jgi:hypothetical protein
LHCKHWGKVQKLTFFFSSAVALWGEEGAREFEEAEAKDKTLERILRENKARRAKRDEFIELQGNEWRIEGFSKPSTNIYHDQGNLTTNNKQQI